MPWRNLINRRVWFVNALILVQKLSAPYILIAFSVLLIQYGINKSVDECTRGELINMATSIITASLSYMLGSRNHRDS